MNVGRRPRNQLEWKQSRRDAAQQQQQQQQLQHPPEQECNRHWEEQRWGRGRLQ